LSGKKKSVSSKGEKEMYWNKVLQLMLIHVTPGIVTGLQQMALELQKKAAETENPIDDIVAYALVSLVGANKGKE
jgi:hypothetical protein